MENEMGTTGTRPGRSGLADRAFPVSAVTIWNGRRDGVPTCFWTTPFHRQDGCPGSLSLPSGLKEDGLDRLICLNV